MYFINCFIQKMQTIWCWANERDLFNCKSREVESWIRASQNIRCRWLLTPRHHFLNFNFSSLQFPLLNLVVFLLFTFWIYTFKYNCLYTLILFFLYVKQMWNPWSMCRCETIPYHGEIPMHSGSRTALNCILFINCRKNVERS